MLKRTVLLACVLGFVVGAVAVPVSAASSPGAPSASAAAAPWLLPASGVFTCDWIAAHVTAAAHWLVTCDPSALAAVDSMNAASGMNAGASPLTNDCQFVPASGYVGKGVYAWSTYEYANFWQWFPHTNPNGEPVAYTWYIQLTNGTNYIHGFQDQTSVGVPANIYRFGAQNNGDYATEWDVCYSG